MKNIIPISDHSVEQVIISMAEAFGVTYTNDQFEFSLNIPINTGSGVIKAFVFDDGVGVVDLKYKLNESLKFQLGKEEVHPLKLVFNTGATFCHMLEDDERYSSLEKNMTMLIASTPQNNHVFSVPKDEEIEMFSIEVNRKLFERRISKFSNSMDVEIENLFRDLTGVLSFSYVADFSYEIGKLIDEFRSTELKGLTKNLFLEAKAQEIFSLFLAQYMEDLRNPDKFKIFRKNHIRSVKDAAGYIQKNLHKKLLVKDVAHTYGLNSHILQNGFKTIYNQSVAEYINNKRLDKAKELLREDELSISQISYEIGLNSKSYFSKLFKDKIGITPSEYKQQTILNNNIG